MAIERGFKKEEFSSPDIIWDLDLNGNVIESGKTIKVSGAHVKLVYLFLIRTLDMRAEVFPSYNTISQHTQISRKGVIRCIKVLENFKLIEKHKRKKGDKNDSNLYIVFHPKQIVSQWAQPISVTVEPRKISHSAIVTPSSGDNMSPYKDISSNKYSSSVVEKDEDYININQEWKKIFKDQLTVTEYTDLIKYGSVEFIIETIDLIHKNYKKHIDVPISFVVSCLQRGGYKVRKINSRKKKIEPKLPRAVRAALEKKYYPPELSKEDLENLAEKQKRIDAKLIAMEQKFKENSKRLGGF